MDVIDRLIEYIKFSNITFSDDEINMIKSSISLIIESSPTTPASVFSRIERLIKASSDISWILLSLKRTRVKLDNALKRRKDPKFVLLTRQGRPSTAAIEAEIRHTDNSVLDMEAKITELDNLIEYMSNVEVNIDRYIRAMRDKSAFIK